VLGAIDALRWVSTRQFGSTPNTSLCPSMNLTSVSVAGPARPRTKPKETRARHQAQDQIPGPSAGKTIS
jgi:hypothetical protein